MARAGILNLLSLPSEPLCFGGRTYLPDVGSSTPTHGPLPSGSEPRLTTLAPPIDQLLGGGLSRGLITEFAGPAASGKTQLALFAAVSLLERHPDATVFYFLTSGSHIHRRVKNVLLTRLRKDCEQVAARTDLTEEGKEAALQRVLVRTGASTAAAKPPSAGGAAVPAQSLNRRQTTEAQQRLTAFKIVQTLDIFEMFQGLAALEELLGKAAEAAVQASPAGHSSSGCCSTTPSLPGPPFSSLPFPVAASPPPVLVVIDSATPLFGPHLGAVKGNFHSHLVLSEFGRKLHHLVSKHNCYCIVTNNTVSLSGGERDGGGGGGAYSAGGGFSGGGGGGGGTAAVASSSLQRSMSIVPSTAVGGSLASGGAGGAAGGRAEMSTSAAEVLSGGATTEKLRPALGAAWSSTPSITLLLAGPAAGPVMAAGGTGAAAGQKGKASSSSSSSASASSSAAALHRRRACLFKASHMAYTDGAMGGGGGGGGGGEGLWVGFSLPDEVC